MPALVGEAALVDKAGLKATLSKVTDNGFEAVLLLSAWSMTRSAGSSRSAGRRSSGDGECVFLGRRAILGQDGGVPPVTEMSSSVKVAGSIGLPKSTATVTDAALVGEVSVVDRVGPGVVCRR